jgi:hypothetical protein
MLEICHGFLHIKLDLAYFSVRGDEFSQSFSKLKKLNK